jgi:selenide,water dikinase
LRHLPSAIPNPNLLVGLETSDDAGVFRLTEDIALVQTVDFFTPIVDDPYLFGQIAAANALSDIYAMGAKPLTVLNIVGFPIKRLERTILADILRGAGDKVRESGATLVGGHSIDDQEPKFGLACTGIVHPDRIRTNSGAQAGDRLILTKPIGVGIQTTAIKKELLTEEQLDRLISVMATLNRTAAEVMEKYSVHACTDVTGFGLLGHAAEMANGSDVSLVIRLADVPILPGTRTLAEQGIVPGGTKANHRWLSGTVQYDKSIDELDQWILCDAVTSGGLLLSVAPDEAQQLVADMREQGVDAVEIGYVTDRMSPYIQIRT